MQVLAGPRQVGKTTLATQLLEELDTPSHYTSADDPSLRDRAWLEEQWEIGRTRAARAGRTGALLVVDEVQKVCGWAEAVKRLWDEDTRRRVPLKLLLLGSAPLLIQRGLSETLAGRFELVRAPHWSFSEMASAFGFGLDEYVFFGGYPGAADLVDDQERWSAYIRDSIVETTVSRDVLLMTRVDKPALLRSLFRVASEYSGQIVSYQKLVGQLQDAGNTTTLAHYLDLLSAAGMVTGLEKFSGGQLRRRRSSPKLLVLNTALISAASGLTLEDARGDRDYWGRLVETAAGAHLVNGLETEIEVLYWRDRGREVDFVIERGRKLTAIEVKSGPDSGLLRGMAAFTERYRPVKTHLVGADGIPIDEFLSFPPRDWIA
jgi:predicted AAA+ superfamily ATPase